MKHTSTRHPLYFLVKAERQNRISLTAIKDERTGKRFACIFVLAQDAEEFMVANDLTFGTWRISQAQGPVSIQGYSHVALRDGIRECVINPPPVIRGVWRTLPIERILTWNRAAREPLLVWAGYKATAKEVEK